MTDLERVREILLGSEKTGPYEGVNIIDAHLKEDAERDRALAAAQEAALTRPSREREVIAEMDDELARLRDKNFNEVEASVALHRENARLRERLDQCKARWEGAADELDRYKEARCDLDHYDELTRLREELDLKDGLLNQAKGEILEVHDKNAHLEGELTRLREQVKYAQGGQYVAVMQENAKLREVIEQHDGPGYTYELDKLQAENDRLREDRNLGKRMYDDLELERDTLLAALRFLLKQVDEVERTSVVRESNIYRDARAVVAEIEGDLVDRMSTDKGPVFYDADQERWIEGKP